jgi:hypothetical protein
MQGLHKRSFGIIMLLLALVAFTPGLSIVAGVLLMIPAFQMIAGMPALVFPRRIAARSLPARHLAAVVQRSVPMLRHLERMVHSRWHTPVEATKRLVDAVVVILSATLVFIPIPLSNVIPALAIGLISLAYIEADGLLLSIALLAATIVLDAGDGCRMGDAGWSSIPGNELCRRAQTPCRSAQPLDCKGRASGLGSNPTERHLRGFVPTASFSV